MSNQFHAHWWRRQARLLRVVTTVGALVASVAPSVRAAAQSSGTPPTKTPDTVPPAKSYWTHAIEFYTQRHAERVKGADQWSPQSEHDANKASNHAPGWEDVLMTGAKAAEAQHQYGVAADDVALAAVATAYPPERATLQHALRGLLQQQRHDHPSAAVLDSLVAQTLDGAFQAAYDRFIPVTKAPHTASGRVVLVEQNTGLSCGSCWEHDRLYAGVRQRYPQHDVVILNYHMGDGYPILSGSNNSVGRLQGDWLKPEDPNHVTGLYEAGEWTGGTTGLWGYIDGATADYGWIGGRSGTVLDSLWDLHQSFLRAPNTPTAAYNIITATIDRRLQQAPDAYVALTVTPVGGTKTRPQAARVQVRVTPIEPRRHVGVRLVLVEDTVRITGWTVRRLQYDAVRSVATFGKKGDWVAPVPAGTPSSTLTYTFDVAALQRGLLRTAAADADGAHTSFPDPHGGWTMQPRRLSVVAIVQDLETKEVLQTAIQRVLPPKL